MSLCLISLDFQKAFDSVWHVALISKLKALGLTDKFLGFITSYLKDRQYQTVVEGYKSNSKTVNCGVPQGSVLGPLLFVVYINDLLFELGDNTYCFADDLYIGLQIRDESFDNDIAILQKKLDIVQKWSTKWKLPLNSNKCSYILFSTRKHVPINFKLGDSQFLTEVRNLRVLGVHLNHKLNWSEHLSLVKRKARRQLGALLHSRAKLTRQAALKFYTSYIRSTMEYCSPLWSGAPSYLLQQLDSIQITATKIIGDNDMEGRHVQPLHTRRIIGGLSYLFIILHDQASPLLNDIKPVLRKTTDVCTRSASDQNLLEIPMSRTSLHQSSFIARMSRYWNVLPSSLRACLTLSSFKRSLNAWYQQNPPPATPFLYGRRSHHQ